MTTRLSIKQVDAFSDVVFGGNPAAVCPLEEWLPDDMLLKIAAENNLSETAYYIRRGEDLFDLRWFTPGAEVDLCGHATLATASVIFSELGDGPEILRFNTRSGELRVRRSGDGFEMDFPKQAPTSVAPPAGLFEALGIDGAVEVLASKYLIVVVENEDIVAALSPDFAALKTLPTKGIAVTAPGRDVDMVSRFFAPAVGVNEDPVTGSAHTMLAPYWAARLGKSVLRGRQGGARKGSLTCEVKDDRVNLIGNAVLYLQGEIYV